MRTSRYKITIIGIRKPNQKNINQHLQWFGNSLGLFNLRDKDKSMFRIFIELVKAAKANKQLTSDEIAAKLNLSRGTVIHHIHKLMDAGIVIYDKGYYMLRVNNLSALIDEIERDMKRTCQELKEVAQDIDKWMGF